MVCLFSSCSYIDSCVSTFYVKKVLGSEAEKNRRQFWELPALLAKFSVWRRYFSLLGKAWTCTARADPWRCRCGGQRGEKVPWSRGGTLPVLVGSYLGSAQQLFQLLLLWLGETLKFPVLERKAGRKSLSCRTLVGRRGILCFSLSHPAGGCFPSIRVTTSVYCSLVLTLKAWETSL